MPIIYTFSGTENFSSEYKSCKDTPRFGVCETAAATATKVVTCDEFRLKKGVHLSVQFTNANTASSPSMNVNGTGVITICGVNGYYVSANMWTAT